MNGQTASMERIDLVDRFNKGESDIFLLSLKAGNTGLNLTGADTVIEQGDQAISRITEQDIREILSI